MSIPFTNEEWATCIKVLRAVSENRSLAPDMEVLKGLVTRVYRDARKERRRTAREEEAAEDRAVMEATGRCRQDAVEPAPLPAPGRTLSVLRRPVFCYICKAPYTEVDAFYHLLCPQCAATNHLWRERRTDLRGRRALITGGRIKIGQITALKLLRDGADVLVTTRYPHDAARRFAAEPDFEAWRSRLRVAQLDLLNLPAVEHFAQHMVETEPALDIIINNAAQTVRRTPEYHAALEAAEVHGALPPAAQALLCPTESEMPFALTTTSSHLAIDFDGEPLDQRPQNSWVLKACEVDTMELLEVHLVTTFAPFILNTRLRPLMVRSQFPHRFVVNVSAMEGQFGRQTKTDKHPHTNMAKAALNMLTRTSASDFAEDHIYMNSVDTGWVTNENPYARKRVQREDGFVPPLDVVDGAARVYAPIIQGNEGAPEYGKFLKDYASHAW